MRVIGIDPGKKGGIAIIDNRHIVSVYQIPLDTDGDIDVNKIYKILFSNDYTTCYLEKVWGMPSQSSKTTFIQGDIYGQIKAMAKLYCEDVQLVASTTWKKVIGVTSDKSTSIAKAQELYPDIELVQKGCRVAHDGIAEALLIMHYGIIKEIELDMIMRGN